jgi:hypothetical protein
MAATPAPEPRAFPDLVPINGQELLEQLVALPISAWNYKFDDASIRHLGPMAQDFFATFGLGGDDKTINLIDANGVVMVAIQALYRRVVALEAELAALKSGEAGSGPAA